MWSRPVPAAYLKLGRRHHLMLATSAQVILLYVALRMGGGPVAVGSMFAAAAVSLAAWRLNLIRWRVIADTPRSRIGSAPQGFVELAGRARSHNGISLSSPFTNAPCVWYRYEVFERKGNKWAKVEESVSAFPFVLEDKSGSVEIDAETAELGGIVPVTSRSGSYKHKEWLITPNMQIAAWGDFVTQGGSRLQLSHATDVNKLVKEWRGDRAELVRRFDKDANGTVDEAEWLAVRSAARAEIDRRHAELRSKPPTNMLVPPKDGRPFLLVRGNGVDAGKSYVIWAWIQMGGFFCALATAGYLMSR